jgi:YVTN family beta-propeller protein
VSYLRTMVLALFVAGPAAAHAADGVVYVYLQPLPSEAARLAFTISAVSAATDAGLDMPLRVSLRGSIAGRDGSRQRLLATGPLGTGGYRSLSVTVSQATLRGETGEAALVVPDSPVKVDVPFVMPHAGAVVLWLTMSKAGLLSGDVTFKPVLSAIVADRPNPGRVGFVSSPGSNTITMFDKRLHQAAVVIPTGGGASGMSLDQRNERLYVACSQDDEIQVIDVTAAEVIERSRLVPGDRPQELALTPDGRTLVSANPGSNTVGIFDASPLTRLDRVRVGNGPSALAIDPTGRRAFVFNALSNSISVLDIGSRSVVATISTESAPLRGAFSARGDRLYVIHERSPYLTVVDALQLTVVTRARLRIGLGSIAVDTRRGLLSIGGRDDPMVEFYDPNTLLPVAAMKTRAGASLLVIDAEENGLYMASPDRRSVLVGGLAERKVVAEIEVGGDPYWVSVTGER